MYSYNKAIKIKKDLKNPSSKFDSTSQVLFWSFVLATGYCSKKSINQGEEDLPGYRTAKN